MYEGHCCGVVANVPDNNVLVSKFEHRSRYYVHLPTKIIRKGMNLFIPTAIGYRSSTRMDLTLNNPPRLICH